MKRRSLLAGLIAAPAIVTAGNIMRINPDLVAPSGRANDAFMWTNEAFLLPPDGRGIWIAPKSNPSGYFGAWEWVSGAPDGLFAWRVGDQSHNIPSGLYVD